MKAFELNQLVFTRIGLCGAPTEVSWYLKCFRRLIGFSAWLFFGVSITSSLVYIKKVVRTDLVNALFASFQATAGFSVFCSMFDAFYHRHNIERVFSKFRQIHGNFCSKNSIFVFILISVIFIFFSQKNWTFRKTSSQKLNKILWNLRFCLHTLYLLDIRFRQYCRLP